MYHDNCCVLNANLDKVPRFDHMIWQIRMPETEQILNVVQGQVLETWETHRARQNFVSYQHMFRQGVSGVGSIARKLILFCCIWQNFLWPWKHQVTGTAI